MMGTLLAWSLPLLLGVGGWAMLRGWPRGAAAWSAAIGGGFVLGNLATAAVLGVLHPARLDRAQALAGSVVAALALGAWWRAWRQRPLLLRPPLEPVAPGERWLVAVLAALLLVHAIVLFDEVRLRPLFPWDAWWVWSVRAKAWALSGQFDPVVAPPLWLAQGEALLRTGTAWNYPPLLAWLELWYALGAGNWNEPLVNLPWFGLWLALLLGCYGQWRQLGVRRAVAAAGTYALGSLPLLEVHVALAGYADLWLAAALVIAALAWLQARASGRWGDWILAGLGAVALPLLKFEGTVWLLCLALPLLADRLPRTWRRWGLGLAIVAIALVTALSVLLDLGWVRLARDLLSGASGGRTASSSFAVLRALGEGLFAQYNWHLLWPLLGVLLAWRWDALRRAPELRRIALALLLGLGFVVALFLLTPAAKWAESYTAVNRLVLQWVGLAVSLGVLLLRPSTAASGALKPVTPAPADTAAAGSPSSASE